MPEYEDTILILAYITDYESGVANATLSYNVNAQERINVTTNKTHNLYTATIPSQQYNATVTYMVYAYDNAGNLAISDEYCYIIGDWHPPTITYIDRVPSTPNYNETALIVVNATEHLLASGIKELTLSYCGDDAWVNITMSFNGSLYTATMPNFPCGTVVSYRIYAVDKAENWVISDLYIYTVTDSFIPTAFIRTPANGSYLSGRVEIEVLLGDDNFKKAKLTVDGALLCAWNATGQYSYSWNTSTVDDGLHVLKLEAFDNYGNMAKHEISVIVDNTSPKVEIQWPLNGTFIRGLVLVKLRAEDANFERMELKIGGFTKVWIDAEQIYAWNTLDYKDGTYNILLTAYDKAGNTDNGRVSVVVDNTPPTIDGITWGPLEPEANETVSVSVQVFEGGSGIKNATLWFRRLGGKWVSKPMTLNGSKWTCAIPGQEENAVILF